MSFFSHCAKDGTSFGCEGGGSGGGQFGALIPGFFGGGFLTVAEWARGAGVGRVLVSAAAGAVIVDGGAWSLGGGGAWSLGGAWGLGLEYWTIICSLAWLPLFGLKHLLAVEKEDGVIIRKPP